MEFNDLRSMVTVISFVVFIGIILWSFSRQRGSDFKDAAVLPLADDGSGVDSQLTRKPLGART